MNAPGKLGFGARFQVIGHERIGMSRDEVTIVGRELHVEDADVLACQPRKIVPVKGEEVSKDVKLLAVEKHGVGFDVHQLEADLLINAAQVSAGRREL